MKQSIILLSLVFLITFSSNCFSEDVLTITYGSQYKPFAWGKNSVAYGIQRDFVEKILVEKMGIKVNHEVYPWKRCQIYVKEGIKDGFFTVPTPERSEYTINSSIPFYETHFVMHTSRQNPKIERLKTVKSLMDLESMPDIKHVHMLGSGWHENALKKMKVVYTSVDASAIPLMLKFQRADVYIEQSEMFRYQAKEKGILKEILTMKEPSIRKLGWHLFISKKSKNIALMPKINNMLEKLKISGELEKIKLEIFKKNGIE